MKAIIDADFDPVVLNRRTMAVWFAFRGEAHTSPYFMPFVDSRDQKMQKALTTICKELHAASTAPATDPSLAAQATIALLDGLWTDFHLNPDRFDRDVAKMLVLTTARAFFPGTFSGTLP